VRGNETQPTRTAGRILHAQLDRLPDSELTITSSAKPVDGGSANGRKGPRSRLPLSGDESLLGPLPTRSSRGEDGELDAALAFGATLGERPENKNKPAGVAANPFPPLTRAVGHNAVGVGFVSLRSPKVAPKTFGATLGW